MATWRHFVLLIALITICGSSSASAADTKEEPELFFAKPYLQLGNRPKAMPSEALTLLWLSTEKKSWAVDVRPANSKVWKPVAKPVSSRPLLHSKHPGMHIFSAELTGLKPGEHFEYQVRTGKEAVFHASGLARKTAKQPLHIVIFGDCASGSQSQKKIAFECSKQKPDLLVVPGDIVYEKGLFREYAKKFFPVYNADQADPKIGGPITRSHLFVPVLGNHDIGYSSGSYSTDLNKYPDALAYFTLWSQPRNGPITRVGAKYTPPLIGSSENKSDFLKTAGSAYPVTANYSFDYGNTHWTVIDGNYYMDWTNSALRDWVRKDIKNAKNSRWHFVTFHQPGFSDDVEHSMEQRMRLLSDVFEETGVDVVWAGHVHNYQRTYPLFFKANQSNGKPTINADGTVTGTFKLDKEYNGSTVTKPKGVLYIVTGAGGAELYSEKQQTDKTEFVYKFIGDVHSYTVCDITGDTMKVNQLSEDGAVIDEFKLTKN